MISHFRSALLASMMFHKQPHLIVSEKASGETSTSLSRSILGCYSFQMRKEPLRKPCYYKQDAGKGKKATPIELSFDINTKRWHFKRFDKKTLATSSSGLAGAP